MSVAAIISVLVLLTNTLTPYASKSSFYTGGELNLFRELESEGNMKVKPSTKVDRLSYARIFNSAHNGVTESCYLLGLVYLYDLVSLAENTSQVDVNSPKPKAHDELAYEWLTVAANKGHKEAKEALALLLYHGHKNVHKNEGKARILLKELVDDGSSRGKWMLGRLLFENSLTDNVRYNKTEAIALLIDAMNEGVPDAMHYLGVLAEYDFISSIDLDAKTLYKQAFDKEFVESGYHLGLLYAYGRTVQQDFARAIDFFRQCVMKYKHAPSMRYLALFYLHGHGVPVDYGLSVYWFQACIESGSEVDIDQCTKDKAELDLLLIEAEMNFDTILEGYLAKSSSENFPMA